VSIIPLNHRKGIVEDGADGGGEREELELLESDLFLMSNVRRLRGGIR
jgi:hypothetical protein